MKKYKIKYLNNDVENSLVVELETLDKAKLPKNIISIEEQTFNLNKIFKKTIKTKDLIFLFYELDLMLQSNISLNDSLNILIKNKKDKNTILLLQSIKNSFTTSSKIEENLKDFKIDYLVVSFLKICHSSGNIKENISALSKLLIENNDVRKSFYKAISYPIVLLISFCLSLISIFYFVVPKFKVIFLQFNGELPLASKALLFVENLFHNYLLFISLGVFFVVILLAYIYKTNEVVEYFIHKILVKKLFLFKDIYLCMELYKLFFVLNIMMNCKYEFHKALNTSKVLLKNKYVLDKIRLIENLLQNGKQINESFSSTTLFDDIVLNLINTGEVSNSLPITINEIRKIYKNRFNDKVNRLINLIQPIFLVLIMALILWIVLAIFIPIWDMGNMIKM